MDHPGGMPVLFNLLRWCAALFPAVPRFVLITFAATILSAKLTRFPQVG